MYNSKLQELRQRWTKEPDNRTIIEVQAKLIKLAMELESKNNPAPEPKTVEQMAEEVFGKESGV